MPPSLANLITTVQGEASLENPRQRRGFSILHSRNPYPGLFMNHTLQLMMLDLGVRPRTVYEVDEKLFDEYR